MPSNPPARLQGLCIGNGPLTLLDGRLLVNQHTGTFLAGLAERAGGVRMLQYCLRSKDLHETGALNAFELGATPGLVGEGVPYRPHHPLWKHVDRLRAYFRLWRRVSGVPWVYIFLPGRYPAFAGRLCLRRRIPFGIYVRGPVDAADPATLALLTAARVVVCNNAKTAGELATTGATVRVARPMMDVTAADVVERKEIRQGGPFEILFVGRVNQEQKGVGDLLRALEELAERGCDFRATLVGSGPLADPRKLPPALVDRVVFPGFVSGKENLAAHYRKADLFVLPTWFEGFPRVLYEAMTYGLPIATTFVDGIPALMTEGANCARLVPGDVAGLRDTIQRLLDSPEERRRLSGGALATIRGIHEHPGDLHADIVAKELVR